MLNETNQLGRVVLLMGGVSSEREVSLMSGAGVEKALKSRGVDVTVFDPKTSSLAELEAGRFDRAFIALHGKLGEDGTIQGVLNFLGPGRHLFLAAPVDDIHLFRPHAARRAA